MITDIEIFNNQISQVKNLAINMDDLEKILLTLPYSGEGLIKDESLENFRLPPIALCFYNYIFEQETIPSEDELVENYLNYPYFIASLDGVVEIIYSGQKLVTTKEKLRARVLRTYPSLIRDFHFYLMLKESGLFKCVKYSFIADFFDRVDIKVMYNNKWYNIALMIASSRSLFYREKKNNRHSPIQTIDILLHKENSKQVGFFRLYTESHLFQLMKKIKHESYITK